MQKICKCVTVIASNNVVQKGRGLIFISVDYFYQCRTDFYQCQTDFYQCPKRVFTVINARRAKVLEGGSDCSCCREDAQAIAAGHFSVLLPL